MKRKTNLFYNSGPDSKFLTFSNYTEALTGNFLSTNTKLFPSTFICLNIPTLTKDNKEAFIKNFLIARYENKLATLRDKSGEENIFPLSYLLDYIKKYDSSSSISYIGNITEQDYLGSYTDTICIIDTQYLQSASIIEHTPTSPSSIVGEENLYGWYNGTEYTGPSVYNNLQPVFDTEDTKYIVDNIYTIEYDRELESIPTSIKFNVLIPLFTFVNINPSTSEVVLNTETELNSNFNTNVPLGIWFADKTIELDTDNTYGQSWSLAIGSQFKPLPTSSKVRSDVYKDPNTDAFKTFAQVLVRQNELLDMIEQKSYIESKYNELLDEYTGVLSRLDSIENILRTIPITE